MVAERGILRSIVLGLLVAVVACTALADEPARPRFEEQGAAARWAEVLSAVQHSPAPVLIGVETWNALVDEHRAGIEHAATHEEFASRVNALFRATGQSHFEYETDAELAYWHLLSAFYRTPDTHVEHIGVFPQLIDGRWFVRGILEGSPAEKLDLREGDELITLDGRPYAPVKAFQGLAGHTVPLVVARAPGRRHTVMVCPVKESIAEAIDRAMERSVAYIPHPAGLVAYAHIWMMLGDGREYQRLLEIQDKVDGLVLDFRDGVGGTPFHGRQFLLGKDDGDRQAKGGDSQKRRTDGGADSRQTGDGLESRPTRKPAKIWTKPVVILIADGTRSAKELLVHDVRQAGRAVLVGMPTPGHVTAVGGMPRIGADAVLILPGFRFALEGKPTAPDVLIDRDLPYCAGRDPQLDRAVELLGELVRDRSSREGAVGSN